MGKITSAQANFSRKYGEALPTKSDTEKGSRMTILDTLQISKRQENMMPALNHRSRNHGNIMSKKPEKESRMPGLDEPQKGYETHNNRNPAFNERPNGNRTSVVEASLHGNKKTEHAHETMPTYREKDRQLNENQTRKQGSMVSMYKNVRRTEDHKQNHNEYASRIQRRSKNHRMGNKGRKNWSCYIYIYQLR